MSSTSCCISFLRSSWLMAIESKASLTNSDTPGLVEISSSSSWGGYEENRGELTLLLQRRVMDKFFMCGAVTFCLSLMETGGVFGLTLSTKDIIQCYCHGDHRFLLQPLTSGLCLRSRIKAQQPSVLHRSAGAGRPQKRAAGFNLHLQAWLTLPLIMTSYQRHKRK